MKSPNGAPGWGALGHEGCVMLRPGHYPLMKELGGNVTTSISRGARSKRRFGGKGRKNVMFQAFFAPFRRESEWPEAHLSPSRAGGSRRGGVAS